MTTRAEEAGCSTEWASPSGIVGAGDPLGKPCAARNENSQYLRQGQEVRAKSFYCSCPYTLISTDTVVDDLGPLRNLRDVGAALKALGPGTDLRQGLDMAEPNSFFQTSATAAELAGRPFQGTFLLLAFQAMLTTPVSMGINIGRFAQINPFARYNTVTSRIEPSAPTREVERNLTVELEAGCQVVKMYVPFAAPQGVSNFWAPCAASFSAEEDADVYTSYSKVIITGLPAGAGKAYAQMVGAYSTVLSQVSGALNNI